MENRIDYRARGPPTQEYHRGMFIDTACDRAQIHSYAAMHGLLEKLQDSYPSDMKLFSAGKSEGHGGPGNAPDVWGVHIMATKKPRRTLFFVAGHHDEFSGPETAYLIAERLLKSHFAGNSYVQSFRKDTHITVIPQIDVYLFDNLDNYDPDNPEKFWKDGYGVTADKQDGVGVMEIMGFETNFYGHENQYMLIYGFPPPKQSLSVKASVEDIVAEYGDPLLAFDYHEDSFGKISAIQQMRPEGIPIKGFIDPRVNHHLSLMMEQDPSSDPFEYTDDTVIRTFSFPIYALEEIAKVSPGKVNFDTNVIDELRAYHFDEFLASKGAESFTFETQRNLALEDKIRINLVGTDRILARYFLGI